MTQPTQLVLVQKRDGTEYNDFLGKYYHFPGNKYLGQFDKLPKEFIYYDPLKNGGTGTYFGAGTITKVFPDNRESGNFFAEIDNYRGFFTEVPLKQNGELLEQTFYNSQNAVRRVSVAEYNKICSIGGLKHSFKARAHLLKLLGDELIGSDKLAVFELVKNSYDANATRVDITVNLESDVPSIVVQDFDGIGMSRSDIVEKWLEVGTDSKRGENRKRTEGQGRMPLGEKGVGRLAAHKLGSTLILNTRQKNAPELEVNINWQNLISSATYIDETEVKIEELEEPKYYTDGQHGTRIEIKSLYNKAWSRRETRSLKRLVTSLCSPFKLVDSKDTFDVNLSIPGREKDFKGMLEAEDVLSLAIWTYDFAIDDNGSFEWTYNYKPPSAFKSLKKKTKSDINVHLELIPDVDIKRSKKTAPEKQKKLLLTFDDLKDIGPILGQFYVYDRRPVALGADSAPQQVRDYLNEQTGVRIYRDGIRVYNYGERGEDWLGLNTKRINRPGTAIGTDSIIGAIDLDLECSHGLKEKTNREGFDETPVFYKLQRIVNSVIEHFLLHQAPDREEMDMYIKGVSQRRRPDPATTFSESIINIREEIKKKKLPARLSNSVDYIESEYNRMKEVTLNTGIAGLNLAVIFHEVEREIETLYDAIKKKEDLDTLTSRCEHLTKLLDGFSPLLKKNQKKNFAAKDLIERVAALSRHRFNYHNVVFSAPVLTGEEPDFQLTEPFGLLQAALTNLVDNSIHWTRLRAEEENGNVTPAIRISTLDDYFEEGPAIAVLDNGTGFRMPPEEAVEPFRGSRPGGMGLGLYYAKMVMDTIGGKLLIMDAPELETDHVFDGAVVCMIFKG